MVRRENKNNAYAKFGGTNKEYYGILRKLAYCWRVERMRPSYNYTNLSIFE